MGTTGADPVFVDTNVLVYAASPSAPEHQPARQALDDLAKSGVATWVSRQVLREYLAVMSRPQTFRSPPPIQSLIADVIQFQQRFLVVEDDATVTSNLLALLSSIRCAGKQVHDANIVATMQAHGLRRLLTHNTVDFARFSGLIAIEPLVTIP